MSKMARTKGYGYEREIANELKSIFPEARRHLEFQGQEAKGYDLDNTGVYRIQCKRYAKYAPITKIEEVIKEEGIVPVLITRGNNQESVACLYLSDFIDMLKKIDCNADLKMKEKIEKIKRILNG